MNHAQHHNIISDKVTVCLYQFLATLWEVLSCYQVLMQIFIFVDLD